MGDCQCPVALANPATPRNNTAIPAAMAQAGRTAFFGRAAMSFGKLIVSASCAGQTATHSKQPVHSTERICTSLSTGSADGQAFAHFAQSMHVSVSRRIRAGLDQEVRPQGPVRAEVAAPEVGHKDGREDEYAEDDQPCFPDVPKEIEHLYIRNQAIRTLHEIADAVHRHGGNGPNKEAQEKIFQATEWQGPPNEGR